MHHVYHMSYLQAIVIGIIQGIGELFPISSLGHTVLIPSWFGGSWATLVSQESLPESPYLAFVVGLHLATALVLLAFYVREWARIAKGLMRTLVRRHIATDAERLAWLIIIATIPVGILGLAFEHQFRVLFAKPFAAACFLTVNGLILAAGEAFRRRNVRLAAAAGVPLAEISAAPSSPATVPAAGQPATRRDFVRSHRSHGRRRRARAGRDRLAELWAERRRRSRSRSGRVIAGIAMVGGCFAA